MTKKVFNINVNWSPQKKSIIDASNDLWSVLKALSTVDSLFSIPVFSKENQKDVSFRIDELPKEEAVNLISLTVLNFSKDDIRKYEKELDPTIEYSRDLGFSIVVAYREQISFNVIIGCSNANGLTLLGYHSEKVNFEWYYNILRALVSGSNAVRGAIGVRDLSFQRAVKNIIAPLGWITYFSKEFDPIIPDNLNGIEYEFTDKGKYLILTRENFNSDTESYEANKQKLLSLMENISKSVKNYSK